VFEERLEVVVTGEREIVSEDLLDLSTVAIKEIVTVGVGVDVTGVRRSHGGVHLGALPVASP
jgi:hypothetical protein